MKFSNAPSAKNLMATARSFGNYDLPAALADLIDNSIKAKAAVVDISFEPAADDVIVRIRDNGHGMDRGTLIDAMRPASANPEDVREPEDLGRFGWGMKSASFSQAKVLTVVSWREGAITAARWDIDNVENWEMDLFVGEDAMGFLVTDPASPSGTEVIWSHSDRLMDHDGRSSIDESLTQLIAHSNHRLALTFHRYLEGEGGQRLRIKVNGAVLDPIDPFMSSHDATQTLDAERIGLGNGGQILVQPYILPHFSKLTTEEQRRLGGPEGMVRNQGFYVYRNRRLIIHGTWFRLVPHGELSQLTRVRVDLPNSVDADWRITVDKSDAQLPAILKRRLKDVVKRFNKRSFRVYRKKGVSIDNPGRQDVWSRVVKNGQIRYVINRDHPMVAGVLDMDEQYVESVLGLLESYFPTDPFLRDAGDDGAGVAQGGTSIEGFEALLLQCLLNYMKSSDGMPEVESFLDSLRGVEPFASQWKYTESHVRENFAKQWGMQDEF